MEVKFYDKTISNQTYQGNSQKVLLSFYLRQDEYNPEKYQELAKGQIFLNEQKDEEL